MVNFWVGVLVVVVMFLILEAIDNGGAASAAYFIIVVVLFVHAGLSMLFTDNRTAVGGYTEESKITSLRVDTELEGIFFIGIGKITNSPKYYFYEKNYTGYVLSSALAEDTTLVEVPTNFRYVVRYTIFRAGGGNFLFGRLIRMEHTYDVVTARILYIPEGTIIIEYSVD